MPERFTERLRQKAAGIWEAEHQHPFVRGIGDGTLTLEKFKFWVQQDQVPHRVCAALGSARRPQSGPGDDDPLRRAAQGNRGNRDEPAPGPTPLIPDAQTVVREASPLPVIVDAVLDLDCQMIIMGTHGRSGLRHLLLGSVAEYVVRNSKVPVLGD